MERPSPVDPFPGLTRRTLLASTVAISALASGCTAAGAERSAGGPTAAAPRFLPDVALAIRALEREHAVVARAAACLPAHPALGPVLHTVTHLHRRHVRVLARALPKGAPRPASTAPPVTVTVPRRAHDVLLTLAADEDRLAGANRHAALVADSGALARLLASMAAASTQLSVTLRQQAVAAPASR